MENTDMNRREDWVMRIKLAIFVTLLVIFTLRMGFTIREQKGHPTLDECAQQCGAVGIRSWEKHDFTNTCVCGAPG